MLAEFKFTYQAQLYLVKSGAHANKLMLEQQSVASARPSYIVWELLNYY